MHRPSPNSHLPAIVHTVVHLAPDAGCAGAVFVGVRVAAGPMMAAGHARAAYAGHVQGHLALHDAGVSLVPRLSLR